MMIGCLSKRNCSQHSTQHIHVYPKRARNQHTSMRASTYNAFKSANAVSTQHNTSCTRNEKQTDKPTNKPSCSSVALLALARLRSRDSDNGFNALMDIKPAMITVPTTPQIMAFPASLCKWQPGCRWRDCMPARSASTSKSFTPAALAASSLGDRQNKHDMAHKPATQGLTGIPFMSSFSQPVTHLLLCGLCILAVDAAKKHGRLPALVVCMFLASGFCVIAKTAVGSFWGSTPCFSIQARVNIS